MRRLTAEILTIAGYTVIEAVDGEDALLKFADHSGAVALVILDVVMPKKNGQGVYLEIMKTHPEMKVIFTSGYTGDVVLTKGVRGDAVDFVSKPLVPDQFLLKIRAVLDR